MTRLYRVLFLVVLVVVFAALLPWQWYPRDWRVWYSDTFGASGFLEQPVTVPAVAGENTEEACQTHKDELKHHCNLLCEHQTTLIIILLASGLEKRRQNCPANFLKEPFTVIIIIKKQARKTAIRVINYARHSILLP